MSSSSHRLRGLLAYALLVVSVFSATTAADGDGSVDSGVADLPRYACPARMMPPTSRNAYVMMHYEGTPKDAEYVLGSRVLIKSLVASGTKQNLVVLASTSVSKKTIEAFCADGAIVQIVDDIPNPFKDSVKPRFLHALNKLHLWRMTRYERVVYLDSDNIVTHNMDELFGCGRFCVVYMNPCHFHTGLIVVKPDLEEYDRLISVLMNGGQSYDGADQGFLSHVYGAELMRAPLFVGNRSLSTDPDDLMRLPIGYNMHHLYRYETMDWSMFAVQRFKYVDPPFMSVTFPIAPALKPWNWLPYALFDMHWEWLKHRTNLRETYFLTIASRLLVLPLAYALVMATARMIANNRSASGRVTAFTNLTISKLGIPRLSWICSYFGVLACVWVSLKFVPQIMPPVPGWLLFVTYINAGVFTCLRLIHFVSEHASGVLPYNSTPVTPSGSSLAAATIVLPSAALSTTKLMIVPLVAQLFCAVFLFTNVQLLIVGNFLEKMLCVIAVMAAFVHTLARSIKWHLAGTLTDIVAQSGLKP